MNWGFFAAQLLVDIGCFVTGWIVGGLYPYWDGE